jgi:hypothetical protein
MSSLDEKPQTQEDWKTKYNELAEVFDAIIENIDNVGFQLTSTAKLNSRKMIAERKRQQATATAIKPATTNVPNTTDNGQATEKV